MEQNPLQPDSLCRIRTVDICGKDRAFLFVSHIDQLEEQVGVFLIDRKVTDLINDQQLIPVQVLQPCFQPVFKLLPLTERHSK